MKKLVFFTTFAILALGLLLLVVRGKQSNGNVYFQDAYDTAVGGPFEGSNSTSRYALTQAIVDDYSYYFDDSKARFASPDLVFYKNKYFSIFTPGISFIAVPFYMLGKYLGYSQLVTFTSTLLFAIGNFILINLLARKLGVTFWAAVMCGFIFTFATNALPYSLTLTQHHASVFVILAGVLLATYRPSFVSNCLLGCLFSAGLLIDIPNVFMMLPIIFYVLWRHFQIDINEKKVTLSFRFVSIGLIIGILPFLFLFAAYNFSLTGSYAKIGQTIGRTDYPPKAENTSLKGEVKDVNKINLPYETRRLLSGLNILLFSNERGIFFFSPVLILGLIGIVIKLKEKKTDKIVLIIISVILVDILSYSMFGDPWGGWSFGPRYLIPASALLAVLCGIAITRYRRNMVYMLIFFVLAGYSVFINSLGALTTNNVPPKVEAVNLTEPIPWTYKYNLKFILENKSASLAYNSYFNTFMSVQSYLYYFSGLVVFVLAILYLFLFISREKGTL